jgi:hypothetical protein
MRRAEFTMGAMVCLVIAGALLAAGLRGPDSSLVFVAYGVTVVLVLTAVLAGRASSGAVREGYYGFALFGGVYLLLAFDPHWGGREELWRPPLYVSEVLPTTAWYYEAIRLAWGDPDDPLTRASQGLSWHDERIPDVMYYRLCVAHLGTVYLAGWMGTWIALALRRWEERTSR